MTRMLLRRDVVEPHSIAVKLGSLGNGLKTIKSNQKKPLEVLFHFDENVPSTIPAPYQLVKYNSYKL